MIRKRIDADDLHVRISNLWKNEWFLLTCGDFEEKHFNTMTVAWGFLGMMWNKPMAVVVVRPTRHTFKFMEQYDTFTLSAFDRQFHKELLLLGTKSGRDGDKIAETSLTPCASQSVPSPSFKEAELIIECRKSYWNDFRPEHFIDPSIDKNYRLKDYHRVYYGEIVEINGTEIYL